MEWLYVAAFVAPATGESVWFVGNSVCKPLFGGFLHAFAQQVGAGCGKSVGLVLDNAGWHTAAGLIVPEDLRLVYLPPCSPELQPAECLWQIVNEPGVNEPGVNEHFETLDELQTVVSNQCRAISDNPERAKAATAFHRWPSVTKTK